MEGRDVTPAGRRLKKSTLQNGKGRKGRGHLRVLVDLQRNRSYGEEMTEETQQGNRHR